MSKSNGRRRIDEVLELLTGVHQGTKGFIAFCPAHEDRKKKSLSVGENEKGDVLLKCFAGCSAQSVCKALGITLADLFADSPRRLVSHSSYRQESYVYRDADGTPAYKVKRTKDKEFYPFAYDRSTEEFARRAGLNGTGRVLYHLDEVTYNTQHIVFWVEGEKDADRLKAAGFVATTAAGGAEGTLPDLGVLQDRHVVIVPDNDPPGRAYGARVAKALTGVAASVKWLELPGLPAKGDVSDFFDSGASVEEFLALAGQALVYSSEAVSEPLKPSRDKPREKKRGKIGHDELEERWRLRYPSMAWDGADWYRYGSGTWSRVSAQIVETQIVDVLKDSKDEGVEVTGHLMGSVLRIARAEVFVEPARWDVSPDILVCANGTLEISTRTLREHRPGDHATNGVPFDYDPDARAEMFTAVLSAALPEETPFLQEFAGYCLTPDTSLETAIWLKGPRGSGKALHVDTPIPTPEGWSTMGNLRPGMKVIDEQGKPTFVKWCSEIMERPTYRVEFSDGSEIVADTEHLWTTLDATARMAINTALGDVPKDWATWKARGKRKTLAIRQEDQTKCAFKNCLLAARANLLCFGHNAQRAAEKKLTPLLYPRPKTETLTTEQIRKTLTFGPRGDTNHSIPATAALCLPELDLPLEPYVLGAWLGDGHTNAGRLTIADKDRYIIDEIEQAGYRIQRYKYKSQTAPTWAIYGLVKDLRAVGVFGRKHIPTQYLRASTKQRIALLQGLMDTDGTVGAASSRCEFVTTNECLANDVYELSTSLGLLVRMSESDATLNGRVVGRRWRLMFSPPFIPFRLPRKTARVKLDGPRKTLRKLRYITAIIPTGITRVRCIAVSSASKLYLAGRAMIPTHNSTVIEGFQAMLGPKHGVLGLAEIDSSPFALAKIPGKTLLTSTEQPASYLKSTHVIDTLISGETLLIDRKYRDAEYVKPTAKVIWAMNEAPRIGNAHAGIFRRVNIVSFPPLEDKRDPVIKEAIKEEGAGILNWALDGLERLNERGGFDPPESVKAATEEWERSNDLPAMFVEEMCVTGSEYEVAARPLYNAFKEWAFEGGHKPASINRVGEDWKRLGFKDKRTKTGRFWTGVQLRTGL